MSPLYLTIFLQLVGALVAGGLIGMERTRRGRMAGLREHALVCLGSCQLMMIGVYAWQGPLTAIPFDSGVERVIQGLMAGIGFLGAGGILKEGFSVRGLTTAASIWVTATLGVLIGLGFYFPAIAGTALTLLSLTVLRWFERKLRDEHEMQLRLRQPRASALHEPAIVALLADHGCHVASLSGHVAADGKYLDYRALIATPDKNASHRLIESLADDARFIEFDLTPVGD